MSTFAFEPVRFSHITISIAATTSFAIFSQNDKTNSSLPKRLNFADLFS